MRWWIFLMYFRLQHCVIMFLPRIHIAHQKLTCSSWLFLWLHTWCVVFPSVTAYGSKWQIILLSAHYRPRSEICRVPGNWICCTHPRTIKDQHNAFLCGLSWAMFKFASWKVDIGPGNVFFPPIGGFPPILREFLTLQRSAQIWGVNGPLYRG